MDRDQEVRQRRLELVRRHVDVANGRGLEIGPLVNPVVTPDIGPILYADHMSTLGLREKYADVPSIDIDKIVPVAFVWGSQTLAEAAADAAPFDHVIAAHVIEHVPDLVGWLREVAEVLKPGGRLCLVVPDRRLTFDVRRRRSDLAEVVEAHLLHLRRPSVRAIFDYFSRSIEVDTAALWRGSKAYDENIPSNLAQGWAHARRAARTDEYVDTHCWVFSDADFVDLMGQLMRLDLLDYRFAGFEPSPVGELEFFAVLERLDPGLSPADRLSAFLDSVPSGDSMAVVPTPREPFDLVGTGGGMLSRREMRLIERKRVTTARASALWRALGPRPIDRMTLWSDTLSKREQVLIERKRTTMAWVRRRRQRAPQDP